MATSPPLDGFFGSGRVYCTRAGRNCNVVGRRTRSAAATAFTEPPSSQQSARHRRVKLPGPPNDTAAVVCGYPGDV